jgi:hypothetical protein
VNDRSRNAKRFTETKATPQFEPGLYTRIFAAKMGWPLRKYNILVEGESDLNYFQFANSLYARETRLTLIGPDLAIFPTGIGDDGGTPGLVEGFPLLRDHIRRDPSPDNKELFRVVVLLDNDKAGRDAFRILKSKDTELLANRDLFVLRRVFPRETREHYQLTQQIECENQPWADMDCEIEDLLENALLELFVEANPRCLHRGLAPVVRSKGHHYEFADGVKPDLFRFVKRNAGIDQLTALIELLKSLRFYLRLDPDGDPV